MAFLSKRNILEKFAPSYHHHLPAAPHHAHAHCLPARTLLPSSPSATTRSPACLPCPATFLPATAAFFFFAICAQRCVRRSMPAACLLFYHSAWDPTCTHTPHVGGGGEVVRQVILYNYMACDLHAFISFLVLPAPPSPPASFLLIKADLRLLPPDVVVKAGGVQAATTTPHARHTGTPPPHGPTSDDCTGGPTCRPASTAYGSATGHHGFPPHLHTHHTPPHTYTHTYTYRLRAHLAHLPDLPLPLRTTFCRLGTACLLNNLAHMPPH